MREGIIFCIIFLKVYFDCFFFIEKGNILTIYGR